MDYVYKFKFILRTSRFVGALVIIPCMLRVKCILSFPTYTSCNVLVITVTSKPPVLVESISHYRSVQNGSRALPVTNIWVKGIKRQEPEADNYVPNIIYDIIFKQKHNKAGNVRVP
jgi:hypothetical protein